jgi:hypothetical protein
VKGDSDSQDRSNKGAKASNKFGGISSVDSRRLVDGSMISVSNPIQITPRAGKENASMMLKSVLDDDPMRRRFRRYLQGLKMDENLRFWDCVMVNKIELNPQKRSISTRAIIQTFVMDSSPFQVNLSSKVKQELLRAHRENDVIALSSESFFDTAMDELFKDLRQSDAFRAFMENDTFSQADLNNSKSDPTVLVTEVGPSNQG